MLAHQSTLEVLGAQLQHILASIQASLQRNIFQSPLTPTATASAVPAAADAAADADHLLVQLVLKLTVEAPQGLCVYLRDVEPLLALPALESACRCVPLIVIFSMLVLDESMHMLCCAAFQHVLTATIHLACA